MAKAANRANVGGDLTVFATKQGYYGGILRNAGDKFGLTDAAHYSDSEEDKEGRGTGWMLWAKNVEGADEIAGNNELEEARGAHAGANTGPAGGMTLVTDKDGRVRARSAVVDEELDISLKIQGDVTPKPIKKITEVVRDENVIHPAATKVEYESRDAKPGETAAPSAAGAPVVSSTAPAKAAAPAKPAENAKPGRV